MADLFAALIGLHEEVEDTCWRRRSYCEDGGLLIQQQCLFEANVADLDSPTQHGVRGCQGHFAVRRPVKYRHSADCVIV